MSDEKFATKCLKSDEFARNAFRTVGEIDVPENAKIICGKGGGEPLEKIRFAVFQTRSGRKKSWPFRLA